MKKEEKPIIIAQIMGKWVGGGVEAVIMNYYRHIDRNKIQFDFICDNDSTNIPYDEIKDLGGRVLLVPPYQKLPQYIRELKKIFKDNKYKIVHSNINTLSVFPLYAAKKSDVPIRIAHSHSTSNKKEFKRNLLKNILKHFSKLYATHYFACSAKAGSFQFSKKTFDKGLVTIINNAIDLEKFKYNEQTRKAKRKELGISDSTLVIGHIGRFVTVKNHSFLIDIFNEIHKINKYSVLLLAGQGPLMEEIKEKVDKLNLTDSIKFLGQRKDAAELYQVMDILLFPSLYEGLGMVLIEAEASGLSCITSTEVPIITKINDNYKFIELNKSAKEWANIVLKMSKHNRNDCSLNLKNCGYDINKEAKKLETKYFELLNNWGEKEKC